MSEPEPGPGERVKTPARRAAEQELLAQINVHYCRALELAWLRWLAVASIPVWLEVHLHLLPSLLTWFAFLGQGLCLAMAASHGALERRWARRAAQLQPGSSGVRIESAWTSWDELRAALWYGVAIVSFVPWAYAGLDRPLPETLLSNLTAAAWTIVLLLGAAETLAAVRPFHGPDGYSGASDAPFTDPIRHRPSGRHLLRTTP